MCGIELIGLSMKLNMSKSAGILIGLLVLTGLASCGGGGSSEPIVVAPTALPSAVVLSASGAVLSRYKGTWTSECGETVSSIRTESARNTYVFGSPVGLRITGTLSQEQYTDRYCSVRLVNISRPTVVASVSLTYVAAVSTDVAAPKTIYDNFTGAADQVTLVTTPDGGAASSRIQYVGFLDDYKTFRLAYGLPFSISDLAYTKCSSC